MSTIDHRKATRRDQAVASAQAEHDAAAHAQALIAPQTPPSAKQLKYLDGLAGKLGHPNARSLAAEILHVVDYRYLNLSAREASQCIDQAKKLIDRQPIRRESKEGVRGRYE